MSDHLRPLPPSCRSEILAADVMAGPFGGRGQERIRRCIRYVHPPGTEHWDARFVWDDNGNYRTAS